MHTIVDHLDDTLIGPVPDIVGGDEGKTELGSLLGPDRLTKSRVLAWHLSLLSFESNTKFVAQRPGLPRIDVVLIEVAVLLKERTSLSPHRRGNADYI